jgi:hypothetical protein
MNYGKTKKIITEYSGKITAASIAQNKLAIFHCEIELLNHRTDAMIAKADILKEKELDILKMEAIYDNVYSDVENETLPDGKKAFSNDEKRKKETELRLANTQSYSDINKLIESKSDETRDIDAYNDAISRLLNMCEALIK